MYGPFVQPRGGLSSGFLTYPSEFKTSFDPGVKGVSFLARFYCPEVGQFQVSYLGGGGFMVYHFLVPPGSNKL